MDCNVVDENSLQSIIRNKSLTSWFQPILDFSGRSVLGYEALIRGPKNTLFHAPQALFAAADACGLLRPLEQLCIEMAIQQFCRQQLNGKLFLNIAAADLGEVDDIDSSIGRILRDNASRLDLVLEISEKYPLADYPRFRTISDYCRQLGIQLAIDDLGSGYSGLRTWAEIRPEYVKVDMHFIHSIDTDGIKREFVRSICEIAKGLNCQVVAEGIEKQSELNTLRHLGVSLGQGYLFQAPSAKPLMDVSLVRALLDSPSAPSARQLRTRPSDTIGDLVQSSSVLAAHTETEDVNDLFLHNPALSSLPVVEDGKPVGIMTRSKMLSLFSGRFSYQLYGKKPIRLFMDEPVIADHETRLDELSHLITNRNTSELTDFIITRDGNYLGVGKVNDLLRRITDQQVRYARYSNPLTMLPGNVPAYECIDELLKQGEEFRVAYVDLNHFKPFNDFYGYNRGDEVLITLGDILSSHLRWDFDLVFHIGGDDFLLIFRSKNWREICEGIFADFDHSRARFYNQQAVRDGGIWGQDRQGRKTFFKLLSISIGVVWPDSHRCHSHHDVSRLATDAKKQAKLRGKDSHSLFLSRRRGTTRFGGAERPRFGEL